MPNFMIENAIRRASGDPEEFVVDLGYVREQGDERGKALRDFGIGLDNFSVEGFGRLLVRIPPRKQAAVLERFPIRAPGRYYGTTHAWREPDV